MYVRNVAYGIERKNGGLWLGNKCQYRPCSVAKVTDIVCGTKGYVKIPVAHFGIGILKFHKTTKKRLIEFESESNVGK
ncbi:hypothetical protein TNCV_3449791 [Trichonephila clavipes]|nr:hypothetical protein TNCV_3449791 [Trichonephila clavipes]